MTTTTSEAPRRGRPRKNEVEVESIDPADLEDELEAEDGEEGEEEDEEDELEEEDAVPPGLVANAVPGVPPVAMPAAIRNRRVTEQLAHEDALAEVMAGLDFSTHDYKISLKRVRPTHDPVSGIAISGHLHTYEGELTVEEVKETHGGGTYEITIRGPRTPGGPIVPLKNRKFEIAGPPRVHGPLQAPASDKANEKQLQLLERVLEKKDKAVESLQAQLTALLSRPPPDTSAGLKEVLSTMNPDKIRDELREERRAQEARTQAEREERRAERDAEQRRFEAKMQEDARRHDKEMQMLRDQMAAKEKEQDRAADRQREAMIKLDMEKDKQARESQSFMLSMMTQANATMMTTVQQANATMMTTMQQLQKSEKDFLLAQLAAKPKDDLGSKLSEFQLMKQVFGGGGSEDKERWEKVLDRVSDGAPSVLAAAAALLGRPLPQVQPQQQPQQQQTAVVAELPPAQPQGSTASNPLAAAPGAAPEVPPPSANDNQLLEISVATPMMDPKDALKLLVQNIDLLIRRGRDATQIYEEVVRKFPNGVLELLRMASVDNCIDTIASAAPAHWAINSVAGNQVVEELHAMLVNQPR